MKRLFLLRHAKAVPASGSMEDRARPLTERGRADAIAMAAYIKDSGYRTERVLCSDSVRTRETLAIGRAFTYLRPRVDFRADLYLAEYATLLSILRNLPARVESVMLVGHNPGMEELAAELIDPDADTAQQERDALEEKIPTAALAVLDFDIADWKHLATHSGRLFDFTTPKTLKA